MYILLLLLAQPVQKPAEVVRDTLKVDSLYQDTVGVSLVTFKADTIIFYTDTKDVLLLHNGEVTYGDLTVYSDSIRFSTSERMLSAYNGARLKSSSDTVSGSVMHYAVETRKGLMEHGSTQIEKGYFYGEGIWLVEENTLHITRGYYTTCDRKNPHYDFYGLQLKVFLNDMVIARPVFLRVGKVPVLAAPFWYLPIGSERKSGLMPFKFGRDSTEGWFVKMIRYYWVPNDYTDALFSMDIMTRKGFRPGALFNWVWGPLGTEYATGSFSANYINEMDTRNQRWNLSLNNTSNIPRSTKLTADLNFRSDASYISDYIENPDSFTIVLDQTTRSNVSLSRSLCGRPISFSASRNDDLVTGSYDMTLPSFNFSWPTANLLNFFTLSFGSFTTENRYDHKVTYEVDSLFDSTRVVTDTRNTSFSQPLSLSWGYTFFGAYTFSQSLGAGQRLTWSDDSLIRGGDYILTNSFGTTLYRLFGIYLLGMNGVLHTVSPSVSYTITPATASIHPWLVYPRFDTTLARHTVSLSLGQTFQTKLRSRQDTTKFNKQNLLSIGTNIGYNLLSDSLTPLGASVYLPSGLPITANIGIGYNIYTGGFTLSTSVSANVDELLFPIFGLGGKKPASDTADTLEGPKSDTLVPDTVSKDSLGKVSEPKKETFAERFSKSKLYISDVWGKTFNEADASTPMHMISLNADFYLPLDIELRFSMSTNLSEPKESWQDYLANYSFSLVKGLHCWEAVFEVTPRGSLTNIEWDFYLRIKELPDIQLGKGLLRQLGGG